LKLARIVEGCKANMGSLTSPGDAAEKLLGAVCHYFGGIGRHLTEATQRKVREAKAEHGSNVVLIGNLEGAGLCRHRAILFKYLVDACFPADSLRCRLLRGCYGEEAHAWNVVQA